MPTLCRDCDAVLIQPGAELSGACPQCGGRRLISHAELGTLAIAHIDCDAFFASVEKRDRPELRDRPVIVGGGTRGVVAACCYVARLSGVRSAMPMFKALKLCPDATVIHPDLSKYGAVAREIRDMMQSLTPLVQPLSIDEAALDLAGTEALHGAPPAAVLSRLARDVETNVGVTVSIGLAANRLRAKLAAERDKPRGFAILGADTAAVLAPEPLGTLPGIGPALVRKLAGLGMTRIGQLAALDPRTARQRLGDDGPSLVARARGEDNRRVNPVRETKSISAETTFAHDITDPVLLGRALWPLCEKLGRRLRAEQFAAAALVLKLKTARFETHTHAIRLTAPTQLPETIFEAAKPIVHQAAGPAFRLIGIGAARLVPANLADHGDLMDQESPRRAARQQAMDTIRAKFGADIIRRGTVE
ncbi:MAG: DNA polymerase IV [Acidiphilium sp. 37-64-53]|uniref:DNA polymerase IV n=1 Tax=Acidiphilium TaxID=522 RepID=UPI000BD87F2B|nr:MULTISPECIES: DNA polymerase IV [Acidiphilium]OYW00419.1 MAG: DNA polymerase IV [Acidiphilium sp. 37-64-53]OZB25637.1 MAG: DNA polymerase IV [Acidiphilium sp. 34-64-41]HQT86509.1 DNA polymerase IV [Acidiphilium rubrum]